MTSLAHNLKNDTRFDDLKADLAKIAQTDGAGRDSRIKWGLRLLDAAYEGVIDMVKDKHGKDEDDAVHLCADYALNQRNATQFDTKSDTGKVQISKARTVIRCGGLVQLGRGEPINTVNNLMNARRVMRRDPALAGKLDDAFVTLLRYCRIQLKSPSKLLDSPEELRALCLKPTPRRKSIEEKLKAMYKDVDSLIKGTMQHGKMQFSCDELELAREGLKDSIRVFARGGSTSSEDDPCKQLASAVTAPDAGFPETPNGAIAALYGTPTDELPPIVTMDDIEAQRAREEGEEVDKPADDPLGDEYGGPPPEDEEDEEDDTGTAEDENEEDEDVLRT